MDLEKTQQQQQQQQQRRRRRNKATVVQIQVGGLAYAKSLLMLWPTTTRPDLKS
jgi:hypothetical protein